MSLILDALKKSEAERQRQVSPTLLEVHVAKPPRRYPIWALAVAILLALNMILLLAFVLRRSSHPAAESPSATARTPVTAPVPTPPAATMAPASAPLAATATSAPVTTQAAVAVPAPAAVSDRAPTLAQNSADTPFNPADEEPAVAPSSGNGKVQHDTSTGYSSLPSFSEVGGNLPDLRLDLHVYADRPRDRYALINMQTVHEGDTLSEGARIIAITREGVALDYRGQQFMLRPQ